VKVAIDVRTVTPVRSGVGNYVLHLFNGLREVAPNDDFFLIGQQRNLEVIDPHYPAHQTHKTKISHENHPVGDLWEHFLLPRILKRHEVSLLHGPATLVPLSQGSYGTVVTIHDLVAFLFPETIPKKYAYYMRWLLKRVVKRADRIISVSENTKQDLVEVLGVDPKRISVVYEAAQPMFKHIDDPLILADVKSRYGIDGPFFYHVGNIEPRKNLVRLIRAYLQLREKVGRQVKLVISGQKGWLTGQLYRGFTGLDLDDDVIFTGYVPHSDLPLLMNAAQAFIFPSLYEGFGLPVLEAMKCGTPVLTSNISSLPEIVGHAAILVDPYDEESIAHGMEQLVEDGELSARLANDGLEQSSLFSWKKAAAETLKIYKQVLFARSQT
jgi:glycosyltransferase involved in cell wall biosynthesis